MSEVAQLGFRSIGRLRSDANLKFLYEGPQKGRGNRRRYDGKANLAAPSRFPFIKAQDSGVSLYTTVVWSVSLKRLVRLTYLLKEQDDQQSYVVIFSTDTDLDPVELYRCYAARFQIEFIFQDARQFTGIADCQARSPQALDSHVNASLTALSLAKAALQATQANQAKPLWFSIASVKRQVLNQHLLDLLQPCSTWSQL